MRIWRGVAVSRRRRGKWSKVEYQSQAKNKHATKNSQANGAQRTMDEQATIISQHRLRQRLSPYQRYTQLCGAHLVVTVINVDDANVRSDADDGVYSAACWAAPFTSAAAARVDPARFPAVSLNASRTGPI